MTRQMTFGVALRNRGPLATPDALEQMARRAEELGYAHIWVGDHIALPTVTRSSYPYAGKQSRPLQADEPYTEAITTLAYLAGVTDGIGIGTRVLVVPLRHPVIAAKSLATLDYLSRGRLTVGVGVGWLAEEFELVGAENFTRRGAVTDEYLALFRTLWSAEEPTFEGEFVTFHDARLLPQPASPGGPSIWVGGHSDAALRRAARLGDAWFPIGLAGSAGLEPSELGARVNTLRTLTAGFGRARNDVGVTFSASVQFGSRESGRLLTGHGQQVARDLSAYGDAGVDTFIAAFTGDLAAQLANLERFMSDVVPHVAPLM
jgi:probable F420-dependent oxidoreductase